MGDFVSLGFALVTPHALQGWEEKSVPPVFYTPSTCLCDLYPSSDLLGWQGKESQLDGHYASLGLSHAESKALTEHLQTLFDRRLWGLDSIFAELPEARAVARRWLSGVADLKLLGMELPGDWLASFLAVYQDGNGKDICAQGKGFAAQAGAAVQGGRILGFEVLGVDAWSDTHTSACSDVRQDFRAGFGAEFNAHGFLTTLQQAELAAREYMFEADGSGIEDCDWFPVRISEWALEAPHES